MSEPQAPQDLPPIIRETFDMSTMAGDEDLHQRLLEVVAGDVCASLICYPHPTEPHQAVLELMPWAAPPHPGAASTEGFVTTTEGGRAKLVARMEDLLWDDRYESMRCYRDEILPRWTTLEMLPRGATREPRVSALAGRSFIIDPTKEKDRTASAIWDPIKGAYSIPPPPPTPPSAAPTDPGPTDAREREDRINTAYQLVMFAPAYSPNECRYFSSPMPDWVRQEVEDRLRKTFAEQALFSRANHPVPKACATPNARSVPKKRYVQ